MDTDEHTMNYCKKENEYFKSIDGLITRPFD